MDFQKDSLREMAEGSATDLDARPETALASETRPAPVPPKLDEARLRLTWNRFDIAIKMHWLDCLPDGPSAFAERLYDAHFQAMNAEQVVRPGVAVAEPGQARASFESNLRSIREGGFDPQRHRITAASDGSVLTGAHAAACALALDRPAPVERTSVPPVVYDHDYFRQRGLSEVQLDAAALRFVERAPDSFVALIWPAAQGREEEIGRIFAPVVYRKEVSLDPNGAHNLLTQVYAGEPWLGDPARNHPGVRNKLVPCFSRSGPLRAFVFQASSLEDVLSAKQAVRDLFDIGKHSVHITDTHAEAVMLARLLLNDRGVHFLNAAHPSRFASTSRMASGFEDYLRRRGVSAERVAVDSGMVLAAYGLREAQDVDFVSAIEMEDEGLFSPHGAGAHQLPLGDLLHDPRNHFHYWGLKLVSLEQVARMKSRRKAGRDLDDLRLIGPVLAAGSRHPRLGLAMSHLRFAAAKGRRRLIEGTKRLGLYGPLKEARRRLRGRRA